MAISVLTSLVLAVCLSDLESIGLQVRRFPTGLNLDPPDDVGVAPSRVVVGRGS